jgi:S-adenosylmethionine-diacylglycerol 3-amino-3-carboxypropyl transferase
MGSKASTEVAARADFSRIRYAQVWEDADVLLAGLDIQPGDVCLSIASAGDNALAMLARDPSRVIAVDLNPAQLACLELRVAAYRHLSHPELLGLIGSTEHPERAVLYAACCEDLSANARAFWDANPDTLARGIGTGGKFENYFRSFRERVLPLIHSRECIEALFEPRTRDQREAFYEDRWNSMRWRMLFHVFFSRFVMGKFGRDPSFFRYVEGSVSDRILSRTRHALVELDPCENPYLQWILYGRHTTALPFALRPENFDRIRSRLDRLEWRLGSLEDALTDLGPTSIDGCNLSDIFEYMSAERSHELLGALANAARPGSRLAYWNMLTARSRPESMAAALVPLTELAEQQHLADKAFFYSRFVIEEVQ